MLETLSTPEPQPAEAGLSAERRSQAAKLVHLFEKDAEFFHSPEGEPYAFVDVNGHRETWRLHRDSCGRQLTGRYHAAYHSPPSATALDEAIATLSAKAIYDSPQRAVHLRVAED